MKESDLGTFIVPKKKREITKKDIPGYHQIKELIIFEDLQTIGCGTFSMQKIETLKLPSSVKRIGVSAFYSNPLKELIINEGLEWIGADAFRECQLTTLLIPKTVNHIGTNAFEGNPLEKVIIDIYSPYALGYEEDLFDIFGKNVVIEKQDLNIIDKKIKVLKPTRK